ncbi:MAG: hypothetical protein ACOX7Q_05745 [Kiritimatiellia bacterium]
MERLHRTGSTCPPRPPWTSPPPWPTCTAAPGTASTFTLVYTGAIWNRTGQDVTWSFMMDYDDAGRLVIDRTNVVIFAA